MNNTGVYIQLFGEETPIFISMTPGKLQLFQKQLESATEPGFLRVKTAECEKHYNLRYIKEITIQGELF